MAVRRHAHHAHQLVPAGAHLRRVGQRVAVGIGEDPVEVLVNDDAARRVRFPHEGTVLLRVHIHHRRPVGQRFDPEPLRRSQTAAGVVAGFHPHHPVAVVGHRDGGCQAEDVRPDAVIQRVARTGLPASAPGRRLR